MTRLLDLLLSALALVVCLPALALIALILGLRGVWKGRGGRGFWRQIFFVQPRVGRGRRTFGMLKLSTMNAEEQPLDLPSEARHGGLPPALQGSNVTVQGDPRVHGLGRILRRTKLNELPQLLNVLLGQMSLIGPRPVPAREFGLYTAEVQATLATLRPGLSGVASILFRHEEALLADRAEPQRFYVEVIAPYKGTLALWFAARRGLGLYLRLIWLTLEAMARPRSTLIWRTLPDIPPPPPSLQAALGYPGASGDDGGGGHPPSTFTTLAIATSLAAAGLGAWEVGLTRLATLLYSRTLAYQALAVALLAMGLGAWWAAKRRWSGAALARGALALMGPTLLLGAAACTTRDAAWGLGAFAWPFALFGVALAGVWQACRAGGEAARRRQYRWELVGAAVGLAALGPLAVAWAGSLATAWVGATLCSLGALVLAWPQPATSATIQGATAGVDTNAAAWRWLAAAGLVVSATGVLATGVDHAPLETPLAAGVGNATHLRRILQREQIAAVHTAHSAWARTDWLVAPTAHMSWILADGRFVARSVAWDGRRRDFACSKVERLAQLKRLPWRARPGQQRALIIGAGGGFDVAVALQEGAQQVTAVELNADTVAFARRDGARNGHIFDRPEVEVVVADGRRWTEQVARREPSRRFDQIQLALMETAPGGVRGRSTAHGRLLTVEAVRLWRDRLAKRGVLALLFNRPELWRNTMVQLAAGLGRDWRQHTWAVQLRPEKGTYNPFSYLLVYSPTPWTPAERSRVRRLARRVHGAIEPLPTISAAERAAATRDDRPAPPAPAQSRLELLLAAVAGLLGLVLAGRRWRDARVKLGALLAGVALAWLQISAVEWMTAATGAPALAIGATIAAMLLGAAAGTALPWPKLGTSGAHNTALWAAALAAVGFALAGAPLSAGLMELTTSAAAWRLSAALFALALPLGAPWMTAMRLGAHQEGQVVAADGLGAVVGAGVSGALLHEVGLRGSCWAAAAVLAVVALLLRR